MERRIYGLETEFGVTATTNGQRRLTPDEVSRALFRKVVAWGRSSNVFLDNGSRLYLDVGAHPEYATAECDTLLDLVAHDRAGERILDDMTSEAQERLAEDGVEGSIYVFKNNTDSAGNSYGCHENFLVSRRGDFQQVSDHLIPFLISRQLTCGAGKIAMLGIPPAAMPLDWNPIIFKGLTIKGIYGREMFETWYKMASLIQSGLDVKPVITHHFAIDDFQQGFDVMNSGQSGKVILNWD